MGLGPQKIRIPPPREGDVPCVYRPSGPSRCHSTRVHVTRLDRVRRSADRDLVTAIVDSLTARELECNVEVAADYVVQHQRSNPWLAEPEGLRLRYYVEPLVGEELRGYISAALAEVHTYKRTWCKVATCPGSCSYAHHPLEKRAAIAPCARECPVRQCPLGVLAELEVRRRNGQLRLSAPLSADARKELVQSVAVRNQAAQSHRSWLERHELSFKGESVGAPLTSFEEVVHPDDLLQLASLCSSKGIDHYFCPNAHSPRELLTSHFNTPRRAVLCPLLSRGCAGRDCRYRSIFAHSRDEVGACAIFGTLLRRPGIFCADVVDGATVLKAQQQIRRLDDGTDEGRERAQLQAKADMARVEEVRRRAENCETEPVWVFVRGPDGPGRFVLTTPSPEQQVAAQHCIRTRRLGFVVHTADPLLHKYDGGHAVGQPHYLLPQHTVLADAGVVFADHHAHPEAWHRYVQTIDREEEARQIRLRERVAAASWKAAWFDRLRRLLDEAQTCLAVNGSELLVPLSDDAKLPAIKARLGELHDVFEQVYATRREHRQKAKVEDIKARISEVLQEELWRRRWKRDQSHDLRFRAADRVIRGIVEDREQREAAKKRAVPGLEMRILEMQNVISANADGDDVDSKSMVDVGTQTKLSPRRRLYTRDLRLDRERVHVRCDAHQMTDALVCRDRVTRGTETSSRGSSRGSCVRRPPLNDGDFPPLSLIAAVSADQVPASEYTGRRARLRSSWLQSGAWAATEETSAPLMRANIDLLFRRAPSSPCYLRRSHPMIERVRRALAGAEAIRDPIDDLESAYRDSCLLAGEQLPSWKLPSGLTSARPDWGHEELWAGALLEKVMASHWIPP
ncbi:MAG: hypothetical protein KVP17_001422 [Porospora cf. gigantea B]|uniref:uncharacterized protein n=1 Tax=Porospora cf. gigantea B TaxID=2853592 RepID=UPI003571CAE1|nr:MAG: hypothetical protein KVP17_001422 [Porospora cf. gigantea B]